MNKTTILVTGGAGFIGSHTTLQLLEAGFEVVVVDNLSNSSAESLKRVEKLSGESVIFYELDIRNEAELDRIFSQHNIHGVIHFAGLKAVGESNEMPLEYFDQNVGGTIKLLRAMKHAQCHNLVFSSSATVYGNPKGCPITEDHPTSATNPYGRTKLHIEEILGDLAASSSIWNIAVLRYFNPIGSHESGMIGEDPRGIPNNLMPYISQVAIGKLEKLSIFGNDYPTKDGTGVRDYIHVEDLSEAHVKAIQKVENLNGLATINLGTGTGYSVLEMITAFEKVTNTKVSYEFSPRRKGDIAECWADASFAEEKLGWKASRGLEKMIEDAWRWQTNNPAGYN